MIKKQSEKLELMKRNERIAFVLFGFLFLLSGAAGLIYQVVWQRSLQIYFGVTSYSVTLIVAAYMLGQGLGAIWAGRISSKLKSALRSYAILEICIGAFGLISLWLLISVGKATAGSSYLAVFLLSFLLLLIPTFLMGATLPLLTQGLLRKVENAGSVVGVLYGINTLGAAFGALLSGYLFIGWLGLSGAVYLAVAINVIVGVFALIFLKVLRTQDSTEMESEPNKKVPSAAPRIAWNYKVILLAAFLTGFVNLGYEMFWVRLLGIVNKHTVYLFPSVLFIFLLGLAIGGMIFGRISDRSDEPVRLFCKIEIAVAISVGITFFLFYSFLNLPWFADFIQSRFTIFQQPISPFVLIDNAAVFSKKALLSELLIYFLPTIFLILPGGILMGGGLPVLDRLAIESTQMAGKRVAEVHLLNIFGSVLGTVLVSFWLLQDFGSEITLKLLVVSGAFYIAIWLFGRNKASSKVSGNTYFYSTAVVLVLLAIVLPGKNMFYNRLYSVAMQSDVYIEEDRDGVLAFTGVNEPPVPPSHFWIGGEVNSVFPSNGVYERYSMLCASAAAPERVLILGFGGGNTARFFTEIPGVKEIVIVELYGNISPFLATHLDFIDPILTDERVTYIVDDGRRYLYDNVDKKFDVIMMDPFRNYTAGANNLYAQEAMSLYQSHLTPQGITCIWHDEHQIIPNTTVSVFPYVDEFNNLLIASNDTIQYRMSRLDDFHSVLMNRTEPIEIDPYHLLESYSWNQDDLLKMSASLPLLTDMNPILEYYLFNKPLIIEEGQMNYDEFIQRIVDCDDVCRQQLLQAKFY